MAFKLFNSVTAIFNSGKIEQCNRIKFETRQSTDIEDVLFWYYTRLF